MSKLFDILRGRRQDDKPSFLDRRRDRLLHGVNLALVLLALLAVASLVAEYGFNLSDEWAALTQLATTVVLYGFVAQGVLKLLLVEDRAKHARERWGELSLLALILLYLLFPGPISSFFLSFDSELTPEAVTRLYIAVTQVLVLLALVPPTLRYSGRVMAMNIQPPMLILLSFLSLVLIGTGLLLLPRATVGGSMNVIDALFMSTSAVCVTGLLVVDTATYFTPFGHGILLALIQIGGLGIMTLTTFFAYVVGSGSNLKEYATMQSLLGEESIGKIRSVIVQIALVTVAVELVGAFLLYQSVEASEFATDGKRAFFAVFHAVSSYCNAGFTLTTENLSASFLRFNVGVSVTVMVLVTLGGLGFPVLVNLGRLLRPKSQDGSRSRLTLHSKVVLLTSLALLLTGAAGFYFLERDDAIANLSTGEQALAALLHSVSARTAGFNTVDIGALTAPTLFLITLLMWIGASPGSTGGGIKTTTFTLSLLNIYAIASGRNKVELFRKQVADISVIKAFSTIILSFFMINGALYALIVTESHPFQALLFEVVSALSTVGLSTGITPSLSTSGKGIIILCMFVGRVGLLAVVVALTRRRSGEHYDFTQEQVLVT